MKRDNFVIIFIFIINISCNGKKIERDFPIIIQEKSIECGPICLQMIGKYYGRNLDLERLKKISKMDKNGTNLVGLSSAADSIGLKNLGVEISYQQLVTAPLPAIIHWNGNHFLIAYKANEKKVWVADPSKGKIEYTKEDFCKGWIEPNVNQNNQGVALLLEITDDFFKEK